MPAARPSGYLDVIIVGDDRGVQAMLMKLDLALSPPEIFRFLQGTVDPWLRARASMRFRSEGDDVSGPWLPLAPATENIRAKQGFPRSHPINRRTGDLESYITGSPSVVAARNGGAFLRYPGTRAGGELGEKVQTAQQGKVTAFTQTPPRPVLGINETDLAFVLTSLAQRIAT